LSLTAKMFRKRRSSRLPNLSPRRLKEFDGVNIAELQKKAAAADGYIEKQRAEVTRLAKLAELGADEGDLDEVITGVDHGADFDRLVKLESYQEESR
jgi:hypothetical protein